MATLLWAACSSHENELEPQPGPAPVDSTAIAFGGAMDEGQEQVMGTRAETALEDEGVHSFKIWAYKNMSVSDGSYGNEQTVINGYYVNWVATTAGTTATNTHDWEYVTGSQSIKYWDFSASAYRFFGYALPTGIAADAVTVSGPTAGEVTFTVTADASDQTDPQAPYVSRLWFSNGDSPAYGQTVQMRFIKPFAQVCFKFIDQNGKDFDNEDDIIYDIHFAPTNGSPIATSGTFSLRYPLSGTGTEMTFVSISETTATLSAFVIPYDEDGSKHWYTVLPTTGQGSYTMSILGDTKTAVVPAVYLDWLPGYYYTYIFKVAPFGLTFDSVQVGIRDWASGGDVDHPVYNW